jgi:hypothetical protein
MNSYIYKYRVIFLVIRPFNSELKVNIRTLLFLHLLLKHTLEIQSSIWNKLDMSSLLWDNVLNLIYKIP